jgi:hypothetical protein
LSLLSNIGRFGAGSSPAEVDAEGVAALVAAAQAHLPSVGTRRSTAEVLSLATEEDVQVGAIPFGEFHTFLGVPSIHPQAVVYFRDTI